MAARSLSQVDLAGIGGADVVTFILRLPHVPDDVCAGGDSLSFQSLELSVGRWTQLIRYDTRQIVFYGQFIHNRECIPAVSENLDRAPVRFRIHFDERAAFWLDAYPCRVGYNQHLPSVDLDQAPVLEVIPCQCTV